MKRLLVCVLGSLAMLSAAPSRATLQPGDLAASSFFGFSVAASGNLMAVSAPLLNGNSSFGQGAVYVYQRQSGGNWVQQARLAAPVAEFNDDFGLSLALEGNLLIVGAPLAGGGAGRVFEYQLLNGAWTNTATLTGATGDLHYGHNVSLSRGTLAVGSGALNTASVYLYNRDARTNTWLAPARLRSNGTSSVLGYGYALDLRGDTLAVGAPHSDQVFVYGRRNGVWTLDASLAAPAEYAGSLFGWSVSTDKGRLAIGAPVGSLGGAVFVYSLVNGAWTAATRFESSTLGVLPFANLGLAVTLANDQLAMGAPAAAVGSVTVVAFNNNTWTQVGQYFADAGGPEALFGRAIALPDNNTTVITSPGFSVGGVNYLGAVDSFQR